jgi:hypothetical protein
MDDSVVVTLVVVIMVTVVYFTRSLVSHVLLNLVDVLTRTRIGSSVTTRVLFHSSALRGSLWLFAYNALFWCIKHYNKSVDGAWTCMNYGFAFPPRDSILDSSFVPASSKPPLSSTASPIDICESSLAPFVLLSTERYSLQLYHFVVSLGLAACNAKDPSLGAKDFEGLAMIEIGSGRGGGTISRLHPLGVQVAS